MLELLTAMAAAAILAQPAEPAPSPPATPVVQAKVSSSKLAKSDDPDKIICKSFATTGTRILSRDCRTQFQWDQLRTDSRDHVNALTQDLNKYEPK